MEEGNCTPRAARLTKYGLMMQAFLVWAVTPVLGTTGLCVFNLFLSRHPNLVQVSWEGFGFELQWRQSLTALTHHGRTVTAYGEEV